MSKMGGLDRHGAQSKLGVTKSVPWLCRLGFHKFYYLCQHMVTSKIKCRKCGTERIVGTI